MLAQKMLVPVDGSATGEAALPVAEAIARRTGSALALVRAADRNSTAAIDAAEEYVGTLAQGLTDRHVTVEWGVPVGTAAEWIIEETDFRKATLVVMATHDRTGPDRWLHGSVAETVISRSPVPVMVIRGTPSADVVDRLAAPQPTIVVPLDGSEFAEAAMPVAAQLAREWNARLVLMTVIPPNDQLAYVDGLMTTFSEDDLRTQRWQAEGYLRSAAAQFDTDVVQATRVVIGDPAAEIHVTAEDVKAAAVVMATHGRTGVMRTLLGSVAGKVVHSSALPVVLVRAAALRGAEAPATASYAATT